MVLFGGYAAFVVADARLVFKVAENRSLEQVATLSTQAITAVYCAEMLCAIRPQSFVLIHSAAAWVSFLIQLAKHKGALVLGTTRSASKVAYFTGQPRRLPNQLPGKRFCLGSESHHARAGGRSGF